MSPPKRHWPQYVGALVLFIVLAGAGSAYAALSFVESLWPKQAPGTGDVSGIGDIDPSVTRWIDKVEPGQPQTILLIGSDKRDKKSVDGGRTGELSDTIMLARLDGQGSSALLSIPRDTQVQIPLKGGGFRTAKINEAFAEGGEALTMQVVRRLLGVKLSHVVVINFNAFQKAVNQLGCLYQDIDRSYFNDNSGGENYATINVQSGYQLLCGSDTLDWVRFRHTDSDLVRAARQQAFLRAAKNQVAASKLASNAGDLIAIFRKYTRTDIDSASKILGLIKLALNSTQHPLQSIKFRAVEQPGTTFLIATPSNIAIMKREFEHIDPPKGPTTTKTKSAGTTSKAVKQKVAGLATGLVRVGDETTSQQLLKASFAVGSTLPVYYPSARLAVGGYAQRDPVRSYRIKAGRYSKRSYPAFRLTYSAGEGQYYGQYYGIQGTTWKEAPILREPHNTVKRGSRTLLTYSAGGRYQLVAWVTDRAVYWVSNTISLALGNKQMLDIAASLKRVPG